MDQLANSGSRVDGANQGEAGFVTAQFMLVAAFSMVFLALMMHVIAMQYAHGVVRSALDEGVRVGSPAPATPDDCQDAVDRVLGDLLSGPIGAELSAVCTEEAGLVVARAVGFLPGWFPGEPDLAISVEVVAVKESNA